MKKISVVINTLNEEKNIKRAINSVEWADEIIVCDMYSDDKTVEIAKKAGAKIVYHKKTNYVEPARNFTVSCASNEWILILDADEEIPPTLALELQKMVKKPIVAGVVEIPRKNIIFGKWMKTSLWWPDYHPRFFKKGTVIWQNKIHSKPQILGESLKLLEEEKFAIIHHHYESLAQFIERMNRYTTIQVKELQDDGYKFIWTDTVTKPLGEFLNRFFANQGFKDGLHGLALSLLQAFSFLVMYLKVWEREKFKTSDIDLSELQKVSKNAGWEINYWFKYATLSKNPFKSFLQKVKNKFS